MTSLFVELLENLLEPCTGKVWLQKIANLLKQLLSAKYISFCSYVDNLTVFAGDDLTSINQSILNEQKIIVNLSCDGFLEIIWDKKPLKQELEYYNNIFSMISSSLKNRSNLYDRGKDVLYAECLFKLQTIITSSASLKEQISLIAKEITAVLSASRCQIKIFSQNTALPKHSALLNFDTTLTSECVVGGFLDALSVIPYFEQEWLKELQEGEKGYLEKKYNPTSDTILQDVEILLSIRSIFALPLIYKNNVMGVLVLHQCDYERDFKASEINFLKEIALLLGVVIGKELDGSRNSTVDSYGHVISSDEFLRELNHVQIETQISNSVFSLIMVDVERLKDINLKMGFVAGNLVLSQTARYLNRLFGNTYRIARYSNDEFVIIMQGVDKNKAKLETNKLKDYLSNISVLGVGPVEYNFSFVTYPTHSSSTSELLLLLEQAMILSKSRGKSQISSFDEVQGQSKDRWQQLVANAMPEIILRKSSLKTGPEIIETIRKQVDEVSEKHKYSADILDSVQSLALALDAKDSYTEGHSKRVSEYAYLLAKSLNLDLQEIEWIRLAASMHDIGKIGIPESILCKPAKLTKEEYEIMKKHPVIGAKILKPIKPLEKVANLVLYHHEYWDGSGYPNGLSKTEVPVGARIISIVDAFQAMTSNRPYRSTLPWEEAINRLNAGKEKQWDPELVEMFIKIIS